MLREEIFKKRFDHFYPMLCRIAYSYVPFMEDCEDIVQETFIAVWNKGKDGLEETEFVAYMVRAVKNNCVSFLRKQQQSVISLEDQSVAAATLHLTDEENEVPQYEEQLEQLLAVLPPRCKEIFLLSKLHGLKYREIAERMNLSEKTVENQMGKAIRLLREQIRSGRFLLFFSLVLWLIKV